MMELWFIDVQGSIVRKYHTPYSMFKYGLLKSTYRSRCHYVIRKAQMISTQTNVNATVLRFFISFLPWYYY